MRAVIVIPARWGSSRFPGKPLALIAGVSLIQRVYERAAKSRRAAAVYVATDDERIAQHVRSFGGGVLLPEGDFASGTDRVAAAIRLAHEEAEIIVNLQGDEPLIDIANVDGLIDLVGRTGAKIGTMACGIATDEEFAARDVVKVVTDPAGTALFFSRAPIGSRETALRHIGIYAFRRFALERFVALPPSPLELAESLEQLRAVEFGFHISVLRTEKPHLGVDRPEDVARVEAELGKNRVS